MSFGVSTANNLPASQCTELNDLVSVHPTMTKEEIIGGLVPVFSNDPAIQKVLGTILPFKAGTPKALYEQLQGFVSTEEATKATEPHEIEEGREGKS